MFRSFLRRWWLWAAVMGATLGIGWFVVANMTPLNDALQLATTVAFVGITFLYGVETARLAQDVVEERRRQRRVEALELIDVLDLIEPTLTELREAFQLLLTDATIRRHPADSPKARRGLAVQATDALVQSLAVAREKSPPVLVPQVDDVINNIKDVRTAYLHAKKVYSDLHAGQTTATGTDTDFTEFERRWEEYRPEDYTVQPAWEELRDDRASVVLNVTRRVDGLRAALRRTRKTLSRY